MLPRLVTATFALAWQSALACSLVTQCPPSFELDWQGRCELRTVYQRYAGTQGHGDAQAALPALRRSYTPAQIGLGRFLFFDPLLSADRQSSRAHCHHPDHGFSDGRAREAGFGALGAGSQRKGGVTLQRRALSLWNVGFATALFWDGQAIDLELQARAQTSHHQQVGGLMPRRIVIGI
jgi:cytochrome c peroxidase